jgi:hypothetical protein
VTQINPFTQQAPQQQQAQQQPAVDEFEIMRRRLRQRGAARGEQAQRQVARQAAALGNLPSGAALRQRQEAAQIAEEQTGRELQDVNILQAQTQRAEREAAAERGLRRFGIETQARVAERGQDIQKFGIETQAATTREGFDLQRYQIDTQAALTKRGQDIDKFISGQQIATTQRGQDIQKQIAERGYANDMDIATLNAENALELAKQQGANDQELATLQFGYNEQLQKMQIEADERARVYMENNIDRRLATQLAHNKNLQIMENKLREKGLNIQEMLAEQTIDTAQQEIILNQAATVINSFAPLRELGFKQEEIGDILEALDIPFTDAMVEMYNDTSPGLKEPLSKLKKPETLATMTPDEIMNELGDAAIWGAGGE